MLNKKPNDFASGIFFAIICYLAWGMFPLFWKQLSHVDAVQVLAHRILWSFIFVFLLILLSKRKKYLIVLKQRRTWIWLTITGILIGTNWVVYIYAISNGHIVESSFGYYINPLMNVALGVIVLKERLPKLQIVAIILAFLGILVISIHLGRIPIISLVLATSFALYALYRKIANIDSMTALLVETIVLLPFAIGWIMYSEINGSSYFGSDTTTTILLMLGGVVTAIPLFWFGIATRKIPLSTIGFIQYLSPTIQLILGIVVYKETFSSSHIIGFGFVWVALIIFSVSIYQRFHQQKSINNEKD
jgi:chloramphenicol-sensitive protein RarD